MNPIQPTLERMFNLKGNTNEYMVVETGEDDIYYKVQEACKKNSISYIENYNHEQRWYPSQRGVNVPYKLQFDIVKVNSLTLAIFRPVTSCIDHKSMRDTIQKLCQIPVYSYKSVQDLPIEIEYPSPILDKGPAEDLPLHSSLSLEERQALQAVDLACHVGSAYSQELLSDILKRYHYEHICGPVTLTYDTKTVIDIPNNRPDLYCYASLRIAKINNIFVVFVHNQSNLSDQQLLRAKISEWFPDAKMVLHQEEARYLSFFLLHHSNITLLLQEREISGVPIKTVAW